MPQQALSDKQRGLIHDLALEARALLTKEARELLEGIYGLYPDGRLDPPDKLPLVQSDPEAGETYRRLAQFLADEERAGLPRPEAVAKLAKEIAFTHLNRLVAFKMMEARKLIRGTLDKGLDSNAFKFYLTDAANATDYARFQQGDADTAYRHFLLWQAGQVAREVRVLFDPDNLASRLFPRPRALQALLAMLNRPELAACWLADETIGWLYQFFNEQEKADVFDRLYKQKQKIRRQDLPAATQLFTPHWIVRFLVQNTLGRLWVQMHPDTRLLGSNLLDYLVPIPGGAETTANHQPPTADRGPETGDVQIKKSLISNLQSPSLVPSEPLRPIKEVTLLDPACGAMHFGLVAFDLFVAMYQEELERVGEAGWLDTPSVSDTAEIAAAIIENNLFGIDIDLRAVQLSALVLYLKAKALNKNAHITDSHLACADVLPLNGARLGEFLREAHFTRPIYERLIRALWAKLKDLNEIGSLLRLEEELDSLIAEERARYDKAPLFAGLLGEFEREAAEEEFWQIISVQIIQGLDEFARQQAAAGHDATFFVGEATKGLRVLDLMSRRYDVVVSNPPYSGSKNLSYTLNNFLTKAYPFAKGDLFSAFIARCGEYIHSGGRVGMLTNHAFMFLSSFNPLREWLGENFIIEVINHLGTRTIMDLSNPNAQGFTIFCLQRKQPSVDTTTTCFRLVYAPGGDGKRQGFEQALQNAQDTYYVPQSHFDSIPGSPWAYWVNDAIRVKFKIFPKLAEIAQPKQGLATADNMRFLRYWWEIGQGKIAFGCSNRHQAKLTDKRWFPYTKGGPYLKWYGNHEYVVNWKKDGFEIQNFYNPNGRLASRPQNTDYYFREGITWSLMSSKGFSARYMPFGSIMGHKGPASFFPSGEDLLVGLATLNSKAVVGLLNVLSALVGFEIGQLSLLPVPQAKSSLIANLAIQAIKLRVGFSTKNETTFDFISPPFWETGLKNLAATQSFLTELEVKIDDEVYHLYGFSDEDRAFIEADLAAGGLIEAEVEDEENNTEVEDENEIMVEALMTIEELAVRWISYAVGVVSGRFQPGVAGALGSAIYRQTDFTVGSLPEPDEGEFDQLVGPLDHFAYVDAEGGRHFFPAQVEAALAALALTDGITVLDEGHPRDLPTLVEKALCLMLDGSAEQGTQAAEVIRTGADGDPSTSLRASLRKFLERDFFTDWHFSWYRHRPVYWPLQSARRSYGFVLFHERVNHSTLYGLQRDYLDHKLNGLRLHLGDLQGQLPNLSSSARKAVERQIDKASQQLDEVGEFARTIERLVRQGYEPAENWIDDGIILRLAPLWELLPLWKTEPKKYWERLQKGDFDWSHIAMHYWPDRVKEKCKTNKSFAIAHGLDK